MPEGDHGHETLSSRPVFDGRIFRAYQDKVRLPDGKEALWERVAHPGAVGMVPIDPAGMLVMVRQYRHAVGDFLIEIPAGKLEPGEPPEQCASRELVEEINYRAGEMLKLAEFYNSPGYSDEYFYLYLARDLVPESGESEPDEYLEIVTMPMEEAVDMVLRGLIKDAKSIIGITLARMFERGET